MKVKNNNITKEHHISTGYVSQKRKLRVIRNCMFQEKLFVFYFFFCYKTEAKLKEPIGVAC